MFKKIIFCFVVVALASCGESGTKQFKTPSGFEYTHAKIGTVKANKGDYVSFSLIIEGSDGRILQDIPKGPNMPSMQLPTPENPLSQPNPILEAMVDASIGDSLVLIMPADSMPTLKSNPAFANLEYLKYSAVVEDLVDEKTFKARQEEMRLEQEAAAEVSKKRVPEIKEMIANTLKDYKSGKLKTEQLDSGLKYVIHEQGTGAQAENNKLVAVDYYGVTMDGEMFDNSFRRGSPYTFPLGKGQVIKGWDLGIALLKKGGKATLFIPYELGYGEAGKPPSIGPKAELVFYVELVDVN